VAELDDMLELVRASPMNRSTGSAQSSNFLLWVMKRLAFTA
jgi:hypothetical protein